MERNGVEQRYFPFKFVFLLLRANDRLRGAGEGATPPRVFLEFYYPRVNINTLFM